MNRLALPTLLALAFLTLLTGCPGRRPPVPSTAAEPSWNVTFRDAAQEAGIEYAFAEQLKSPLTILHASTGGCALVDLDGDGWLDAVLVGPSHCAVYHNLRNGHFEDATARMGLARPGFWMGCAVGDYDNDGYPDLLLTGYHCLALLHNEGGARFRDVTREAGLRTDLWTTSAAFFDMDGDGLLDLYVGAYVDYRVGHMDLCPLGSVHTACGPELYPAQRGRLYRNRGGGRFQDVTTGSGLDKAAGKTWGVAISDYDEDGKPDLYLANDQVPGNLFHNLGGGHFEDVGVLTGTAMDANGQVQGGMGVDWGDSNGDGRLDLFVTTYYQQDDQLYLNEGAGLFRPVANSTGLSGPTRPRVGFGCGFLDADNDGALDLLVTNGHVRDNAAQVDGAQEYAQPLQLFANRGDGTYQDVSARAGAPFAIPMVGRGMAFGDYDNDGRVDALVVDLAGNARLLHNEGGAHSGNWCTLRLNAGKGNRFGIGARITVESGGSRQVREVTTARALLSASDSRVYLGLGAEKRINRVTVRWPDHATESWSDLPANQVLTLAQGHGRTAAQKH